MGHFAVQQKLPQHCKSTILQLKEKKKKFGKEMWHDLTYTFKGSLAVALSTDWRGKGVWRASRENAEDEFRGYCSNPDRRSKSF